MYSNKAFLFSLYNTYGYYPVKLGIWQNYGYAIYTHSGYGPTFSNGHDMYISDHASSNANSHVQYVYSYDNPPGCSGYGYWCSFYIGQTSFTPDDIEVFYETTN